MSYFEGMAFFCLLPILLLPAILLGVLERPIRHYALGVSVLLLFWIFGQDRAQLSYLLLYFFGSWLLVWIYQRIRAKKGRESRSYHICIMLGILPLALCKLTPLAGYNIFGFLGISYLTFRVIQIIIETYDGVIEEISFADFASFLLFFPSISSGPIDRSRRFLGDWYRSLSREDYLRLCSQGIWKLLQGLIYKMILAAYAYQLMGYLRGESHWYLTIAYAYAYGLYLFFDFAGYSLMAVGVSYCFGIETPDNFRAPFLAVDLRDFWDRWHITLSHWFRDYIFTRFIMYSTKKKWFPDRLMRACAGFLVNMGIMGIWHGLSPAYIAYGLYHGILLAGTEFYQKKSSFYKKHKTKSWYRVCSWFVTMQMVMAGFYLFSLGA